jgi:hypothetical protein
MNRYIFRFFINLDEEVLRKVEVFSGETFREAIENFNKKYGFMNEVNDTWDAVKAKQGIYAWRLMEKSRIDDD